MCAYSSDSIKNPQLEDSFSTFVMNGKLIFLIGFILISQFALCDVVLGDDDTGRFSALFITNVVSAFLSQLDGNCFRSGDLDMDANSDVGVTECFSSNDARCTQRGDLEYI